MRWLVLALSPLLAACDDEFPDYRYRMTVEVQTPEGLRTGSSVIGVDTKSVSTIQDSSGRTIRATYHGQAVAVDLPRGRTLFALLGSLENPSYAVSAPHWALKPERTTGGDLAGAAEDLAQMLQVKGPRDLPLGHWPLLVHFRNPNDPSTVQEVKPSDVADSLGPGIYIRRIIIELTDEDVSTGIERRFPWWDSYNRRHLDGSDAILTSLTTTRLAAQLTPTSFSTEAEK